MTAAHGAESLDAVTRQAGAQPELGRYGVILAEHPHFAFQISYIPPVGETFTQGMTRALDGLAERIVEMMETDW